MVISTSAATRQSSYGFDFSGVCCVRDGVLPAESLLSRRSVLGDDGAGAGVRAGVGLGFDTSPGLFDVERVAIG
jgi:hypothetical protein